MKKIYKYILVSLTTLPSISLAQIVINIPAPSSSTTNLMTLLRSIVNNILLPIGAVLVVMYIIYAGFTFVQAQGNPKKIEEAQRRFLWSLIGAAVLLGAVAISGALCTTINAIVGGTTNYCS